MKLVLMTILGCAVLHTGALDDSTPATSNVRGADYPRVSADRRATFSLRAPGARTVQLQPGGGDNGLSTGPISKSDFVIFCRPDSIYAMSRND